MPLNKIRHEIYDENGLVRVEEIEIDEPTIDEQITEKELQLLKMYEELLLLKQQKDNGSI